MWLQELLESIFKELLARGAGVDKVLVFPPRKVWLHDPRFPWKR